MFIHDVLVKENTSGEMVNIWYSLMGIVAICHISSAFFHQVDRKGIYKMSTEFAIIFH